MQLNFLKKNVFLLPWVLLLCYSSFSFYTNGLQEYIFPTVFELIAVYLFTSLVLTYLRIPFALFGFICYVLMLPVLLQVQFVFTSGDYVSELALWNADSASFITMPYQEFIPFIIFFVLFTFIPARLYTLSKKVSMAYVVVFLSYALIVFYSASVNKIDYKYRSPLSSAIITYFKYHHMVNKSKKDSVSQVEKDNALNRFKKNEYYGDDSNFTHLLSNAPKRPNVIVFFIEGMSANIIDSYGGRYGDLTPNLDTLSEKSIMVTNYYNHTAATFRGLRGQLSSSYQYRGGSDSQNKGYDQISKNELIENSLVKFSTLPNILRVKGYRSYFISPHYQGANLNTSLETLGFDKVFTRADNPDAKGNLQSPMTDRELIDFLKKNVNQLKSPFFIGLYNFGTHLTIDSPDIKYQDGRSNVLNRFHNIDAQFGRFMDYFHESGMDKNTVLIFTTDHASFPAPEFTDFIETPKRYFIDKIPLLIYWGGVVPTKINARGSNTINLAPTIMNILRYKKGENFFLGCSLFESNCLTKTNMEAYGDSYFISDQQNVYPEFALPEDKRKAFAEGKNMILESYKMTANP